MNKKIIALVLSLVLAVSMLTIGVAATPDEEAVTLFGYGMGSTSFIGFSKPQELTATTAQSDQPTVWAGTCVGNLYYGVDGDGKLFSADLDTFTRTYIGTVIEDTAKGYAAEMTYDAVSGRLLLLIHDKQTDLRTGTLYAVDTGTAALTQLCRIGNDLAIQALAADPDGKLYGIDRQGDLYLIDMTTGLPSKIGSTGYALKLLQSMTFDRKSGTLYWARFSADGGVLCTVNTATADVTDIGAIGDNLQVTGLSIAQNDFRVRIEYENGGSATDNGTGYYAAGEHVSLTATPDKGYVFGGWTTSAGVLSVTKEETCTLVLPDPGQDVTVKAYFVPAKNDYTERTVRDNNAGIAIKGERIYYNATVSVQALTEGDAYQALQAKTKNKPILDAYDLKLNAHVAQGEKLSYKGSVTVSVRVDAAYEGKRMTVWQVIEDKVVTTTGVVKDGVLTYKTESVAPMAITAGGGTVLITALLIVLSLVILAVLVVWVLHLRHMKRLRARQAARQGKPLPKKKSLRTRIGNWLRARRKK